MMKLRVLGNNGPYPEAGQACSGYLIEKENSTFLIDCGSGVLSNLLKFKNLDQISFVVLSHLHFDHMSDILPLRYGLQVLKRKMDIYLPKSPEQVVELLKCDEFNLHFIDEDYKIERDGFSVLFKRTEHPVETYAIKVNDCFIYTADLSKWEPLVEFAKECKLLLADSAYLDKDKIEKPVHLTANECGILAKEAKVHQLLLTHFLPNSDRTLLLERAKSQFKNTNLALILESYPIQF